MRQIFLDTETTGLSPAGGDRILNLACVEMISRKLTNNDFHCYINPERDSHEDALRVHGLTTDFLADKPKFPEIAHEFLAFVKDAEIIIHNATFDVGFLDAELERAGLPKFSTHVAKITDSLAMAKELYPGKRNGLDALCERMGVDNSNRTLHGALLDAQLLAEVYIHLTRGQDALLIDSHSASATSGAGTIKADFSKLDLIILQPSEAELAAHEDVLKQIDKASGGKTVWRAPASA
ncbi:DNA polymerase III subunit epsilon [Variovorax sp. PCZ-1]|uniref:DNA polymerase III subunit epsilon n=1 Tax=Variovorax sp. PCZ-1 TaxID=2835533 RepID=UPI001BCF937F|nr:DNA polymerase III subunit epsilon [Variovorax sp. PCZ-1]MBS7807422.1 DNA polymerase III subunit epsilon [Variovorax sp. PCZ-1]